LGAGKPQGPPGAGRGKKKKIVETKKSVGNKKQKVLGLINFGLIKKIGTSSERDSAEKKEDGVCRRNHQSQRYSNRWMGYDQGKVEGDPDEGG